MTEKTLHYQERHSEYHQQTGAQLVDHVAGKNCHWTMSHLRRNSNHFVKKTVSPQGLKCIFHRVNKHSEMLHTRNRLLLLHLVLMSNEPRSSQITPPTRLYDSAVQHVLLNKNKHKCRTSGTKAGLSVGTNLGKQTDRHVENACYLSQSLHWASQTETRHPTTSVFLILSFFFPVHLCQWVRFTSPTLCTHLLSLLASMVTGLGDDRWPGMGMRLVLSPG